MRRDKQLLCEGIKLKMNDAKGFIVTCYHGMSPNVAAQFRASLFALGGDFEVAQKRILMKASQAFGYELSRSLLQGHIGVIFAKQNLLEVTKSIFHFKNEHEGILEVLSGWFEGKAYSSKEIEFFSTLSSKQELRAQFLALLESVPTQFLAVIEALLTSVGHCLENKITYREV